MENIIELSTCGLCNFIAKRAVESNCCSSIYCQDCSTNINLCRKCNYACTFSSSAALRRLIDMIPELCIYCNERFLHKNIIEHSSHCPNYPQPCNLCHNPIPHQEFFQHLAENHQNFILENIYGGDTLHLVLGQKTNKAGRVARLGTTGKYCCGCCDGNCGPSNGCNCVPCLILDIEMRSLPKKFFVNKIGRICSMTTKGIYCGAKAINDPGTDGHCGPNNGPRCEECKVFHKNFKFIQAEIKKYA